MGSKNNSIEELSSVDKSILEVLKVIVEKIDDKGYLTRILDKYKVSLSDQSVLTKLSALNEDLADAVFDENPQQGEESENSFQILLFEFEEVILKIGSIHCIGKDQWFDFDKNQVRYQIVINPSLKEDLPGSNIKFTYLSMEARDEKWKNLKRKFRQIPQIKFL